MVIWRHWEDVITVLPGFHPFSVFNVACVWRTLVVHAGIESGLFVLFPLPNNVKIGFAGSKQVFNDTLPLRRVATLGASLAPPKPCYR